MSKKTEEQIEDLKRMRARAEADGEDTARFDELIAELEEEPKKKKEAE